MDTLATQTIKGNWFEEYSIDDYNAQLAFPDSPGLVNELLIIILSHLNVNELGKILTVSKKWCVLGSNHAACGDLRKVNIFGKNFWAQFFGLVIDDEPPIEIAKQKKALILVVIEEKKVDSVLIPKGSSINTLAKLIDKDVATYNPSPHPLSIDFDYPAFLDNNEVPESYWVHITGILKESYDPTTELSTVFNDLKPFLETHSCGIAKGVEVMAQSVALFKNSGHLAYKYPSISILPPNFCHRIIFGTDDDRFWFSFSEHENEINACVGMAGIIH